MKLLPEIIFLLLLVVSALKVMNGMPAFVQARVVV